MEFQNICNEMVAPFFIAPPCRWQVNVAYCTSADDFFVVSDIVDDNDDTSTFSDDAVDC